MKLLTSVFALLFGVFASFAQQISHQTNEYVHDSITNGIRSDVPLETDLDSAVAKRLIPAHIEQWLQQEITASKSKHVKGLDPENFFERDTARIVGYIKGFPVDAGFTNGIIYHSNEMTREQHPTAIQVHPDGRFEVSMELFHPVSNRLVLKDHRFPFYLEPGHTLAMVLDWEDFLLMDTIDDFDFVAPSTQYIGALGDVNQALWRHPHTSLDFEALVQDIKTLTPSAFKTKTLAAWDEARVDLAQKLSTEDANPLVKHLLQIELDICYASHLFWFKYHRTSYLEQDRSNQVVKAPIEISYFNFISRLNLEDPSYLVSIYAGNLLHRMEMTPVYSYASHDRLLVPEGTRQRFKKLYGSDELPLLYHFIPLRELHSKYRYSNDSDSLLKARSEVVLAAAPHPVFAQEVQRFDAIRKRRITGYTLPDHPATGTFIQFVAPHRGKVVLIDFWAQWCGPCRDGIERSLPFRQKLRDHPKLEFVYVTDVSGTPDADFFHQYSENNAMRYSHRLTAEEYLAQRELFQFNGIPRYVLVNPDGSIKDDDFRLFNLATQLQQHYPGEFDDLLEENFKMY